MPLSNSSDVNRRDRLLLTCTFEWKLRSAVSGLTTSQLGAHFKRFVIVNDVKFK